MIRLERGDPTSMTIDLVARVAPVVGLELAAALHLDGDPVRDRAHLALLQRFRSRLPPGARWRTEVPVPIAGDLRSGDAVVDVAEGEVLIEAETYLGDIQQSSGSSRRKRVTWVSIALLCSSRILATIARSSEIIPSWHDDSRSARGRLALHCAQVGYRQGTGS
jgi:hypothetical protein